MRKLINRVSKFFKHHALGLLLIRVGVGLVFFMHGWSKINNVPGTEAMFDHMGLGAMTGVFIAWLEVIGGLAVLTGIATRIFALAFGIEMFVAISIAQGWGTAYQPHEFELFLMLVSFGLALAGSGRFSLFSMDCEQCGAMVCDVHKKK